VSISTGRPRVGGRTMRLATRVSPARAPGWRFYAACRGRTTLFYKTDQSEGPGHRPSRAKAICIRCPVRPQCAAYALAVAEPYGIWGGFTERERQLLLGTDWREYADSRCTWVDVTRLQDRLGAIRSGRIRPRGAAATAERRMPSRRVSK
jgi:WhiB family transcriptional regulator, redox-sensing transcriptional regulator